MEKNNNMELVKKLELKISGNDCFRLGGKEYYNFTIKFNNEKEFKILAEKNEEIYMKLNGGKLTFKLEDD